jgi:NAD+ kinase
MTVVLDAPVRSRAIRRATPISTRHSGAPRRFTLVLHPSCSTDAVRDTVALLGRSCGIPVAEVRSHARDPRSGVDDVEPSELCPDDVVVAVGGDRTVLRAMALGAERGVPVLGVALSHLGFLADVRVADLAAGLQAMADGDFTVEESPALVLSGLAAEPIPVFHDAVLSRAGGPAALAVYIGGELLVRYAGDGLIVATSIGSTARSLAAGGPIVAPGVRATLVTPLAPRAPVNRTLVVPASDPVEVEVLASERPVSLAVDGGDHRELYPSTRFSLGPSNLSGRLIRLRNSGFAARAARNLPIPEPPEPVRA